jgi:hypothetical protein
MSELQVKVQVLNRALSIAEATIPFLFGEKMESVLSYLLLRETYDQMPVRYSEIGKAVKISLGNSLDYPLKLLQRYGFVQQVPNGKKTYKLTPEGLVQQVPTGKKAYKLTPAGLIVAKNLFYLVQDTLLKLERGDTAIIEPTARTIAIEELKEILNNLNDVQQQIKTIQQGI